jgi:hypothetical protein
MMAASRTQRTDLRTLCIIQGCLNPRAGANLCAPHEVHTTELGARRAMAQEDEVDALARQLLLVQALLARVEEERTKLRSLMVQQIRPGTTLKPTLTDGTPAGTVLRTVAGVRANIGDPKAFAGWVAKHYPSEVYLPPMPPMAVREAFQAKVLEMSEAVGVAIGPGGETAEDAPKGVRIINTQGVLRVSPDKENTQALWAEIRKGATILEELT